MNDNGRPTVWKQGLNISSLGIVQVFKISVSTSGQKESINWRTWVCFLDATKSDVGLGPLSQQSSKLRLDELQVWVS